MKESGLKVNAHALPYDKDSAPSEEWNERMGTQNEGIKS